MKKTIENLEGEATPSVLTATVVLLALAGGGVHLQHNETLLRGRS